MIQTLSIQAKLHGMNEIIADAKVSSKSKGGKYWSKYAQAKSDFGQIIRTAIKNAKLKPVERSRFNFLWVEGDRRRDPDNIAAGCKFIMDALVAEGIITNDGWDQVAGLEHSYTVSTNKSYWVQVTITAIDVTKGKS